MTSTATAPQTFRCFGCDRTTRDSAKVVIAADGFLRCHECAAYEARLAAPAERPVCSCVGPHSPLSPRCAAFDAAAYAEADAARTAKNAESARVLADYEAAYAEAAPAPALPPVLVRERAVKGLGPLQRKVLRTVGLAGFDHGLTPAQYRRVIRSFVERGLVEHVTDSEYRLTAIGVWAVEN